MAVIRRYFYDVEALARKFPEGEKRRERTEFERDLSRLRHSFSLRRLSGVTQVFQSDGRRTVRNRYSHSVEVADIAAGIAAQLGTDPDVVAAAALAHDLGHPPFGHHGESVLDEFARSIGLDGFEGNAQTLSILSRLEPKIFADGVYYGINPTRAMADATIKYPWRDGEQPGPKFGVYAHDMEYFAWVRGGSVGYETCVEAQIMDWADDVAYCTHDVEDGILAGFIDMAGLADPGERRALCEFASLHPDVSPDDAFEAYDRIVSLEAMGTLAALGPVSAALEAPALIKRLTGALIDRFVDEAVSATRQRYGGQSIGRYDGALVVPTPVRAEAEVLKSMTWRHVIDSTRFQRQRGREVEVLHEVTKRLMDRHAAAMARVRTGGSPADDVVAGSGADPLFTLLWSQSLKLNLDEQARYRSVLDAVASLTDQGLITLARHLPGLL